MTSITLVIETATAACSVALLRDGDVVDARHEVVGRGHAERLIPMIAELSSGGRAERILVDVGPGSFTGVRVGLAAALGLGFGWQAQVSGYSSLAVLAASSFAEHPALEELAVVLEGGHGEVFMQSFAASSGALGPLASLTPTAALAALEGRAAFGSGVRHLLALDAAIFAEEALPQASDARLLRGDQTNLPARPVYGRGPDAKTLAERGLA